MKLSNQVPSVKLHPTSWRELRKGHPWIIKDSFTERFPGSPFLKSIHNNQKVILLNDPSHPKIKARVWDVLPLKATFDINVFKNNLYQRLSQSIERRIPLLEQRDNIYLVFGEADFLPGIFLQKLGNILLLQFYSDSYKAHKKVFFKYLKEIILKQIPQIKWSGLYIQYRNHQQDKKFDTISWNSRPLPTELIIQEFHIKYKIKLNSFYDQGIYTDMSAIRLSLKKYFQQASTVLNLYAYTGAYSLFAMHCGAKQVTSVDLSKKYLAWLNTNLKLNPQLLAQDKHIGITQDTIHFLKETKNNFDLIICDPPSFSSNNKRSSSSFKQYQELLPLLISKLRVDGKVIIFLNTHTINKNKFLKKIKEIIQTKHLPCKIIKHISLQEDCPRKKGFPEGDYLKGFILQITKD